MNIILGVGSIFVGIIKSIDTYFQLGKRSESHRLCSLQYQQIHKKIQIELALQREQRQTAKDMLSVIKTDIKNLQDISPLIDQDIIDNYNDKYGKYTTVKKPNFVNGLTEVAINDTDEHGKDVLHSRPRSVPGSTGGSLSGSDDEGHGGDGSGSSSRNKFNADKLNSLIQIHAIKGGGKNKTGDSENVIHNNVDSLDYHGSVISSPQQHASNIVVDHIRMSPNIAAPLDSTTNTTLSAPSLLNTFNNPDHLHYQIGAAGNDNVIINLEPDNVHHGINNDDSGAM
jgi:hypothetical protein